MDDPVIVGRDTAGRFAPGSRANPRGKPVGARNRATILLDKLAERSAREVLQAVLTAAQAGDISAATLVLSRVWPPRRGRPIQIELPDLMQPNGAPMALAAIIKLTTNGAISPEEAGDVAKVIEAHQRATDMVELLHRIERLEATIAIAAGLDHAGATLGTARRHNGSAAG
jgi:hypothetical protein